MEPGREDSEDLLLAAALAGLVDGDCIMDFVPDSGIFKALTDEGAADDEDG